MDTHSSSARGLLVGREFFFCPSCDTRLKNREYPTFFYKAFGRLFGMDVQFRWQCEDCGYRERGRTNWPLGLCFPGLVLAAVSFVLQSEGFEETAPPEVLEIVKQCLLAVGSFLFGLGFFIFIARLIRSNPVRKISCTICDRYFKRSEAWASTDYCSVECAQAETEEEDEDIEDDELEDEEEDIDDIEEVEEVEEDDAEDVEDVEDVEDDELEESGADAAAKTPSTPSSEPVVAEETKDPVKADATKDSVVDTDNQNDDDEDEDDVDIDSIDEDELEAASAAVDATDEVAEMVLFEDKTEYEIWDPNTIVSEAGDDLDLDAVSDEEIEADQGAPEDINEVENAISLMDSQRKNVLSDRTAMWKVEDILSQTDDLDVMASARVNKSKPDIESERFNNEEIPAGITESGEESLEGSGDKTE